MKIPLATEGRITNTAHSGHVVRVEDDRAQSGGFIIVERWQGSTGPNDGGEFDSWAENEETLERFFSEAGWLVEWSKP